MTIRERIAQEQHVLDFQVLHSQSATKKQIDNQLNKIEVLKKELVK